MNPLIKDQLSKIRRVNVSTYSDSTTQLEFLKSDVKRDTELQADHCYLISVEDYILNPPEGFTLHTNWNNNIIPKHKFMKIDVLQIMGKMIKVNSVGFDMKNQIDIGDTWSGWLPQKSIKIIERL